MWSEHFADYSGSGFLSYTPLHLGTGGYISVKEINKEPDAMYMYVVWLSPFKRDKFLEAGMCPGFPSPQAALLSNMGSFTSGSPTQ